LATGAALWGAVAMVYAGVREPAGAPPPPASKQENWFTQMVGLLREDRPFRNFVIARSLLLVSSLSPPFIVTLAAQSGHDTLSGRGGCIRASGLAALLGGRLFGRIADRSSKGLMAAGSAIASATIIALVVIVALPGFTGEETWQGAIYVAAYFVL